ncbi:MAG: IlvD/Edd family dehydratase [Acidobacteriota bacterium]|jgi:dihydroxy-acid dehydratase|nr:dihydroxy-acid dehydratase [Bryobacteraceae bacterium CoA2 C42]MCA2964364.1 dihydroxy-acid dehydratase [Acidobacteriaceae bacterium]
MDPTKLRSYSWFNGKEYYNFSRRANIRALGLSRQAFHGKPVVGICNSFSELNNCNAHLRQVADAVKRGVWAAGGFPLEFPVISLGEQYMKPTTMLFRNLMAMDVEESVRANPLDGVVMLCGCDKTTPAMLMGAASADVPALILTGGPTLSGNYKGRAIGQGTDGRKIFDLYRTGEVSPEQLEEIEGCMVRSAGHCTVMGTASTMAIIAEALGMSLPGSAAIPAPDSRRLAMAEMAGRRMVEMIAEGLKPSRILTREAFENAVTVDMAIGGSTNAVVHLLAIAGRTPNKLTLDDFDAISRRTPFLVNVRPSGQHMMEEFFYAGGVPAVMRELLPQLHGNALTVNGKTVAENVADAPNHNTDVIRPAANPLHAEGGTVVLRGNLSPHGAVFKQTAASPHLCKHTGPAYVFETYQQMHDTIDSMDLPIDANTVLVMKGCGPHGAPGFPEWGHIPMPKVLLAQGVADCVRISDARMSGTSFGTVVLHVSPESAIGGPLAIVETGDLITLDVEARQLHLHLSEEEIARRLAAWKPAPPHFTRGYGKLFLSHVTQAHLGCDFDFLAAE